MRFECRVSLNDYLRALSLKRRTLKRITYAVLIADLAIWAWWVVWGLRGDVARAASVMSQAIIFLVYPLICLALFPVVGYFSYKRNRNIQKDFTIEITPETMSYTSTSGSSGTSPWSSFRYWRESKAIFLLVFPSNIFLIVPKTYMTDAQQEEFRGIVGPQLAKK